MSDDYIARRRIQGVKDELSRADQRASAQAKELAKLKDEFAKIRSDQARIIENQERMTRALEQLTKAVKDMHAEMYPPLDGTKPKLRKPSQNF